MEYTLLMVKEKLGTDVKWIRRALVVITEKNQTTAEQVSESTISANGIGWNGADAKILTSFARSVKKGWMLSPKQLAVAQRRLPKYAKQVLALINEKGVPEKPVVLDEVFQIKETIMDISSLSGANNPWRGCNEKPVVNLHPIMTPIMDIKPFINVRN